MQLGRNPSPAAGCSRFKEYCLAALLLSSLLRIGADDVAAEERAAPRVLILEQGIYHADSIGRLEKPGTISGLTRVRNPRLLQNTTLVPARRFVRFGVRYVVLGGQNVEPVFLRMITRFPVPGLANPVSGAVHPRNEYVVPTLVGREAYRDYQLEEDWEAVPGIWIFEFWHENRLLGEQSFCIYPEDAPQASSLPPCSLLLSQLH